MTDTLPWVPLQQLKSQLMANLSALAGADAQLADRLRRFRATSTYFISPRHDHVLLGRAPHSVGEPGDPFGNPAPSVEALPHPLPPPQARQGALRMFPQQQCDRSAAVFGLDQGWLWDALFKMPASSPMMPGHRPPLYFLAADLERLWVVLHFQNWSVLLSDPRIRIFAGQDAVAQLLDALDADPMLPIPQISVTLESGLWTTIPHFQAFTEEIVRRRSAKFLDLNARLGPPAADLPTAFSSGRPLRILGITSRFTTFLQHSMRDWLAALEGMGHQTRLMIETANHHCVSTLSFAQFASEFKPDLILLIDHYRGEYQGLPSDAPCVMWIQDRLPHLFRPEAGKAQGPRDYVIGYGRDECTTNWSYSAQRFSSSMVGVRPDRFAAPIDPKLLDAFRCDVAFVSHASTPAQQLIRQEIDRADSPQAKRLLDDIFQRLVGEYDAGRTVTVAAHLRDIITQSLNSLGLTADIQPLLDLFQQRVNNALFRHQSLRWVARLGVDLRLYGKGWEQNLEFARFARGPADNQNQLPAIFQASRINLQVTQYGAVHQRIFEGLCAGGFFLFRATAGDEIDLINQRMWQWCQARHVRSATDMAARLDADLRRMWERMHQLSGVNFADNVEQNFAGLSDAAQGQFSRSASTLWPDYHRVSFASENELAQKVRHYLSHADERAEITRSMRDPVVKFHSYEAISRRMLQMIADDLRATGPQATSALQAA